VIRKKPDVQFVKKMEGSGRRIPVIRNEKEDNTIMKRLVCLGIALVLMLAVCAASAEMMVGGWELAEAQGATLADEGAQAAFEKATKELDGANYVPVALLGKQLVAGMNYCILCQVTPVVPDAQPHYALAYVYTDLQGVSSLTQVIDLDIGALCEYGE
jgi:hypothetical protein